MPTNLQLNLGNDREQPRGIEQFAAELHDGVLQYLVGASMSIDAMKREREVAGEPPSERLNELATLVRSGLEAGRQLIAGALTIDFTAERPSEVITRLVRESADQSRARIDHSINLPAQLEDEVATTVCRVVGEALQNIVRHSRASRASVEVRADRGEIVVSVKDNGRGFDPQAERGGRHFGIDLMRRRIESQGGRLEIESQDGEGTQLLAVIPSTVSD